MDLEVLLRIAESLETIEEIVRSTGTAVGACVVFLVLIFALK